MRTVIVPDYAGALSALGMLLADNVRDYAAGVLSRPDLEKAFRDLERTARREKGAKLERLADIRYAGQSYELTVPWRPENPGELFHREHQQVYGYADLSRPIEVVTVRVRSITCAAKPKITKRTQFSAGKPVSRRVFSGGKFSKTAVYTRAQLTTAKGPALVVDYGSTTLVPPGWTILRDRAGNLVLRN